MKNGSKALLTTNFHTTKQMTHYKAFEILIPHIVSTLPDSMTHREEVLAALTVCAPRGHRCTQLLRQMQVHLEEHQRLQRQWSLELSDHTGAGQ